MLIRTSVDVKMEVTSKVTPTQDQVNMFVLPPVSHRLSLEEWHLQNRFPVSVS